MTEMTKDINLNQVAILLSRYQFEMKSNNIQELLEQWKLKYPVRWIRLGVVEALYQGRYKVISVEHILSLWLRRGHPTFHFNHEFERMICNHMLGSMVINHLDIAQRRQAQTALPRFYQQSAVSSTASNQEIENNLAVNLTENLQSSTSVETQDGNANSFEQELDFDISDEEPTLIENDSVDTSVTQLTNVKELFAQLMSEGHLSESTMTPQDFKIKAEQQTMLDHSIHEFTPHLDDSALYSKLKAVLQQSL